MWLCTPRALVSISRCGIQRFRHDLKVLSARGVVASGECPSQRGRASVVEPRRWPPSAPAQGKRSGWGGGHAPRTPGHHFWPVRATPARAVPADWCRREDDPSASPSLTAVAHPDLPRRPGANASVLVMTSSSRRKPALGRWQDHHLPSSHRTLRGGQVPRPLVRRPQAGNANSWGCREPLLS